MGELKKYISTIITLIVILIVIFIVLNITIRSSFDIVYFIINISFMLLLLLIIFSTIITYNIIMDKNVSKKLMNINFKIVNMIFPLVFLVSKIMNIDKNYIRNVYIQLNNKKIYKSEFDLDPKDILVLLPHCIQKNDCKFKVTTNIKNCRQCGLCDVDKLFTLQQDTNVNIFIATGGTLARKVIKDIRPKAVIAIACERDLTSGVKDIDKIPVLGVFNKRPNGPCINTSIDINEVKKAVKYFIGEC